MLKQFHPPHSRWFICSPKLRFSEHEKLHNGQQALCLTTEKCQASMPDIFNGPEGNRTPVQKPIPCSSTIIVRFLTFPPLDENEHSSGFSSFILRPHTQSFACVVSYIVDAWILMCRCTRSDGR